MSLTPELLERPTLALAVKEIEAHLAAEVPDREAFRHETEPHEKGELIDGEVFKHSPSRDAHHLIRSLIGQVLRFALQAGRWGGHVVSDKATCAFTRNDHEPDVAWISADPTCRPFRLRRPFFFPQDSSLTAAP